MSRIRATLRQLAAAGLLGIGLAVVPGCGAPPKHAANHANGRAEAAKGVERAVVHKGARVALLSETDRLPAIPEGAHYLLTRIRVEKWRSEADRRAGKAPYEVRRWTGNVLTTAGITRMLNLLVGGGGQAFDQTHTRIGVGDGTTAEAASDTDLSAAAGSAHRWFMPLDQAPTVSGNQVTFHATWATGDGNFAWNEFGTDVSTSAAAASAVVSGTGPLLNHKKPGTSLGTKTSGSWALTETITIS